MTELYNGRVSISYGQAYVFDRQPEDIDLASCFRGQSNGLLGAVVPGTLFLITGLETGIVNMRVDLTECEPPLDDEWEDIVEVSFLVAGDAVWLEEWGGGLKFPLAIQPGQYRVRYCCQGMDSEDEVEDDELEPIESSKLVFWPEPAPRPDAVLKLTSGSAKYWHGAARKLVAP